MTVALKEQIKNKIGDEIRNLEMDVTTSFLNSKICSPLFAAGLDILGDATLVKNSAANAMAAAGLYITKDGLQFDPSVVTDITMSIVNIAIEATRVELLSIRNKAWEDITYIPNGSIIFDRAKSYFTYYVTHDFNIDKLLDFSSVEDKLDKLEEEKQQNTVEKVSYWIDKNLPKVTYAVSKGSEEIRKYCSYSAYYASFGPSWLTEKIVTGIDAGSYAVRKEVDKVTYAVNKFKIDQYNKIGDELGKEMVKQYEKLLRNQVKVLNDEVEKNKSKVLIQSKALLQKANLAIMAKTGIKIPIDQITPENLSKVKNATKLAKLANIASGSSSDENTTGGKPADETAVNNESNTPMYSTEYINDILSQVKNVAQKLAIINNDAIFNDDPNALQASRNMVRAQVIEMCFINYLKYGENTFKFDKTYSNMDELMTAAHNLIVEFKNEDNTEEFDMMKMTEKPTFLNTPPQTTV